MALQFLPIALAVGSTLLKFGGAQDAAKASLIAGHRARDAAEAKARSLDVKAGEELAIGQQRGFEETRRARLVASRLVALAASSGGGASDPTVINLMAGISGEGAYRQAVRVYEGKETARGLREQANNVRYEGQMAEEAASMKSKAYRTAAKGAILQGAASMFGSYGMGGPGKTDLSGTDDYSTYSGGRSFGDTGWESA